MSITNRVIFGINFLDEQRFVENHRNALNKEVAVLDGILTNFENMNRQVDKDRFDGELKKSISRFMTENNVISKYYGFVLRYLYDNSQKRPIQSK